MLSLLITAPRLVPKDEDGGHFSSREWESIRLATSDTRYVEDRNLPQSGFVQLNHIAFLTEPPVLKRTRFWRETIQVQVSVYSVIVTRGWISVSCLGLLELVNGTCVP